MIKAFLLLDLRREDGRCVVFPPASISRCGIVGDSGCGEDKWRAPNASTNGCNVSVGGKDAAQEAAAGTGC